MVKRSKNSKLEISSPITPATLLRELREGKMRKKRLRSKYKAVICCAEQVMFVKYVQA